MYCNGIKRTEHIFVINKRQLLCANGERVCTYNVYVRVYIKETGKLNDERLR